jgi:phospholipid/cholesterol/gamma-HCH transport system ATP-binding protein
MAAPIVEVREVWKAFDEKPVLRGISLTLDKGTTLAVMGGSGSGKTVLLRTIDGLLAPDDGEVWLFGTRIDGMREEQLLPLRRRAGYVFQSAALFDSLSVFENVAFPLREHSRLGGRSPTASTTSSSWWGCPPSTTCCQASSRAACASAWASRGRW